MIDSKQKDQNKNTNIFQRKANFDLSIAILSFFYPEFLFISMDRIPFPHIKSPYCERVELEPVTKDQQIKRWTNQPTIVRAFDSVISRVVKYLGLYKPKQKIIFYRVISRIARLYFRFVNRLRVYGAKNIPKKGCIFYVNHPGTHDPLIFMSAVRMPVGMLIAWGNSWFFDFIENHYGIMSLRNFPVNFQVERMVRNIIFKNCHFAIWPEGHPNGKQVVEKGFSSFVKVYTTINAKKDLIPFVPVLLRGAGIYFGNVRGPRFKPIEIHFFEPFFINRDYFNPNSPEFKTPREITDEVMNVLARKNGQKECEENTLYQYKMNRLIQSGKFISR